MGAPKPEKQLSNLAQRFFYKIMMSFVRCIHKEVYHGSVTETLLFAFTDMVYGVT